MILKKTVASECGIHIFRYDANTVCFIFCIIYHSEGAVMSSDIKQPCINNV